MTTKQMHKLKNQDKVTHKRYGESYVLKVIPHFGPVIQPMTKEGLVKLANDSGAIVGTPTLVSDYKQNLKPLPAPPKP